MTCLGGYQISFNCAPNPLKGAKDKKLIFLIFKVPFRGFRGAVEKCSFALLRFAGLIDDSS